MNEISIKWLMTNPPVVPAKWRIWNKENTPDFPREITEIDPEKPALWLKDPLIARILETAFKERLPRSTGWEAAADLDQAVCTRLRLAASIYKRGVAFRTTGATSEPSSQAGSYPIQIVTDRKFFAPLLASTNFVIVDHKVHAAHPEIFAARTDATVIAIDEHEKQPATVARILDAWEKKKQPQEWSIFGGGIVTDAAAFAASLAGCSSTFIPTTLLAMADACVGGKTGVNFRPYGKNLLGHFYFPTRVLVWPGWLSTLDRRQINAGAFECIKHFFLQNDLPAAQNFASAAKNLDLAVIENFLPEVIQVKAAVVAEDPAETSKRAILNFGHTLGHAVEGLSQELTTGDETILHGEAVGIGMAFAIFLSHKTTGLGKAAAQDRITSLRASGGLASRQELKRFFGGRDPGDSEIVRKLSAYITQDKKAGHDASLADWVLLTGDGTLNTPKQNQWLTRLPIDTFPETWREFLTTENSGQSWLAGQS